jgi:hypothetical protein
MSMNLPVKEPDKRRIGLYAIGVLLLSVAGAILLVSNTTAHRPVAMLALFISVICFRKSQNYTLPVSGSEGSHGTRPLVVAHLRKLIVTISIILVPLLGISYASLYYGAMRGGQQVWPVYFFAITACICALFWSILLAMFL